MSNSKLAQFCLDVETSGLTAGYQEIMEIGLVPRNSSLPNFRALVKCRYPERAHPKALEVNGLDPNEGEPVQEVWTKLCYYMKECLKAAPGLRKGRLIGHQVGSFDVVFAHHLFGQEQWNSLFSYRLRDTASACQLLMDAGAINPKSAKLTHLLDCFGIPRADPAHSAIPDATAELALWLAAERFTKLLIEGHGPVASMGVLHSERSTS